MSDQIFSEPRLTSLAHGGGCGCKLAPSVLRDLLAEQPLAQAFPQLLVGNESSDDAAVWQVDDRTCVIATADFFMPMVDDPRDFGRIAATNAISDIYAMGGRPIMALAILGMPIDKLSVPTVRAILAGGAEICAEAGIPVAGGHSIDAPEPIYGLAVIGLAAPEDIRRNGAAQAGDKLILTKGLGVGIYSAAIKKGVLPSGGYEEMIATTTLLNRIGESCPATRRCMRLPMSPASAFWGTGWRWRRARASVCVLRWGRCLSLPMPRHWQKGGWRRALRPGTGPVMAGTWCCPKVCPTGD